MRVSVWCLCVCLCVCIEFHFFDAMHSYRDCIVTRVAAHVVAAHGQSAPSEYASPTLRHACRNAETTMRARPGFRCVGPVDFVVAVGHSLANL